MFANDERPISNLRQYTIPFSADTIKLDTLSILPQSLEIRLSENNELVPENQYLVDYVNSYLLFYQNVTATDSLVVRYRVFPVDFSEEFYKKDIELIEQEDILINPFRYEPQSFASGGALDFGNIDYSGSISRGLSFGNQQDVVLNSSLNLQLRGMITEDVEVLAVISDNNIPIQPEGNTQQLQEFDRVYIQVQSANHRLIAGDYDLNKEADFFMSFRKRLQGASYKGNWELPANQSLQTGLSFAVAKGQFARNRLPVSEGNQGPYRLTGNNGETFLIVLAGSERVFIDEQLMTRGADRDYVIDYNLGEITFTPNRMITKDSRVEVEFEYSDRSYFRSMVHAEAVYEVSPSVTFDFNFYNEQDNKNQPVVQQLNEEQIEFLEQSGDEVEQILFPGVRQEEFDADRIMYKQVDTVINGVFYDSVYVYSTNSDSANYILTFAFVGQGNGNYVPAQTTANGRVYQWVAPQNGQLNGRYEPVIVLAPPEKRQMVTVGMNWNPDDRTKMRTELAYSEFDRNTFSDLDQGNNQGVAAKTAWSRVFNPFQNDSIYINTTIDYEFANRNFNPIERYRPVDFDRNWNYVYNDSNRDEHLLNAELEIGKKTKGYFRYGFSSLFVDELYSGYENRMRSFVNLAGFNIRPSIRYLQSEAGEEEITFFRPGIEIDRKLPFTRGWKAGGNYNYEENVLRKSSDSLSLASFRFYTWGVFIESPDTADVQTRLSYKERTDYLPDDTDFKFESTGRNIQWTGDALFLRNHNLKWNFTYRWLETAESIDNSEEESRYYLGRLEYNFSFLRNVFRTGLFYELGSGREQRREFTYVEVPDGRGNYIWTDYNDNGIKELDEFEPAPPGFEDEAVYIRVFTPTNEFDEVNMTVFNASQNIDPAAVWATETGLKRFVSRFSTQSNVQINRKIFAGSTNTPFNPFNLSVDDIALVSVNSTIRNTLFINRTGRTFNADYSYSDNRNRSILLNGFELRTLEEHSLQNRLNLSRQFQLNLRLIHSLNINDSEAFADRVYRIRNNEVQPRITYLPTTNLRFNLSYLFFIKNNEVEGQEEAIQHQGKIEARFSRAARSTVNLSFSYSRVEYDFSANTPVAFAMLQGLQPGNNYQWVIGYDQNIANNVQLSLSYEGRKTGEADMVHIGRAQVRALF
ncbi:MAG: hypothetical protein EA412_12515 [Chitinophagaceae bacterium]|nr:MAG: hypothetical protein EA412_12515 [Chitinophagaceae bacterium]